VSKYAIRSLLCVGIIGVSFGGGGGPASAASNSVTVAAAGTGQYSTFQADPYGEGEAIELWTISGSVVGRSGSGAVDGNFNLLVVDLYNSGGPFPSNIYYSVLKVSDNLGTATFESNYTSTEEGDVSSDAGVFDFTGAQTWVPVSGLPNFTGDFVLAGNNWGVGPSLLNVAAGVGTFNFAQ
jgi:hypothetical protein